jgi:hypothetical protein
MRFFSPRKFKVYVAASITFKKEKVEVSICNTHYKSFFFLNVIVRLFINNLNNTFFHDYII